MQVNISLDITSTPLLNFGRPLLQRLFMPGTLLPMALLLFLGTISFGSDSAQLLTPAEKNPLYLRHLVPQWQPFQIQPLGTFRWSASANYANIFERRRSAAFTQDFDAEMLSIDLKLFWQAGTNWSLQASGSAHRFSGGFLDASVQKFHRIFGLPNDDRDTVEDNRFAMEFVDHEGNILFQATPHHWYTIDPQVSWIWQQRHGRWEWASGVTAKLPLANGPFSNQRLEGSADIQAKTLFQKWGFAGQFGIVSLNPQQRFVTLMRDYSLFGKFWIERRWFGEGLVFAQIDSSNPYFKDTGLDSLDPPPLNLMLGCFFPVNSRVQLAFHFSEDLSSEGPSLDFSFTVGVFLNAFKD